jgi:hypothetical protein
MRRTFSLFLLLVLIISSVGFSPVKARDNNSHTGQGLAPDDPQNPVYLPLLFHSLPTYAVTGQVTDQQATPLPGVTIADSAGHAAITNSDGTYSMYIPQGDYALAPTAEGYMFTPSMVDVTVMGDITNQDFTAVAVCNEAFYNNGFEISEWWNLLEVNYPSSYSATQVHSGLRSVRMGIVDWWDNRWGYSSVRSPLMVIPTGAGSVTLRLWIFPESTEAITAPETPDLAPAPAPRRAGGRRGRRRARKTPESARRSVAFAGPTLRVRGARAATGRFVVWP